MADLFLPYTHVEPQENSVSLYHPVYIYTHQICVCVCACVYCIYSILTVHTVYTVYIYTVGMEVNICNCIYSVEYTYIHVYVSNCIDIRYLFIYIC